MLINKQDIVSNNEQLYTVAEMAPLYGKGVDAVRAMILKVGCAPVIAAKNLGDNKGWSPALYSKAVLDKLLAEKEKILFAEREKQLEKKEDERVLGKAGKTLSKEVVIGGEKKTLAQVGMKSYVENLRSDTSLESAMEVAANVMGFTAMLAEKMQTLAREIEKKDQEIKLIKEELSTHGTLEKYAEDNDLKYSRVQLSLISRKLGQTKIKRTKIFSLEHKYGVWTYSFSDLDDDRKGPNLGGWALTK